MKNQVIMQVAKQKLEITDAPMPEMKDDEIMMETEYVGVCGSDVHVFEYSKPLQEKAEKQGWSLPVLLGHECSGEVIKVGKNVTNLKVGDKVAIEPQIPCGKCEFCKEGRYNLCEKLLFMASRGYPGALKRYITWPSHMVYKLPENVSTLEGALVEPMAVGMHAAKLSGISLGDEAVIFGAGCIGLTILLACKALGASKVILIDLFDKRLEKAKEMGAYETVNSSQCDPIKRVEEILGHLPGFVFEAAGVGKTASLCADMARKGGTILMVGSQATPASFMFSDAKELTIKTIRRYRNNYPMIIEGISSGKLNVKDIPSHFFDFENAQEAFDNALNNKTDVVKAVIKF